jgi:hypothetical protein
MLYSNWSCSETSDDEMFEMIAYCGLDCSKCDAFRATQTEDLEFKAKIAERWSKELNREFTPEDITCDGCKSDRLSAWCQSVCKIRPCGEGRSVATCAHCGDFACEKLEHFLTDEPVAKETLEAIHREIGTV